MLSDGGTDPQRISRRRPRSSDRSWARARRAGARPQAPICYAWAGMRLPFDNSYARLGGPFFARVQPTQVRAPRMLRFNHALARTLGLDATALDSPDGA